MRNFEKFKTAQERAKAYCRSKMKTSFLDGDFCEKFKQFIEWLDLEAEEEKPLPCVYCNGVVKCHKTREGFICICSECGATAIIQPIPELAIESYNRVAKAVRESEVKK